jgi:hypothetical protein
VQHLASGGFHLDVVDLFSARLRNQFLADAASELNLDDPQRLRRDMHAVLLACEDHVLDLQRESEQSDHAPVMTAAEEHAALQLLRDPQLLDRISDDFTALGIVGERDNAVLAYLGAVSRLLDTPLAVVLQSGSGTGKSTLADTVLSLIPAEARLAVSALTAQSLFYLADTALTHKVLAVAEVQGAQRATYALKLLTSEGELSIASTGKDTASGALATRTYRVHGPVALLLTTSAATLDDELANRAIVVGVDDEQSQTTAILAAQRHAQTLDGLIARQERQAIRDLHTHAQRLLEPLPVVIPFASELTFTDRRTRARRDQPKLLSLIRAIALLHQHQRPRKRICRQGIETIYIEATAVDAAVAQRLTAGSNGRADLTELGPQTRGLLERLDVLVASESRTRHCSRADIRFTRRQAREHTGWSDYATRRHLARLVELEFACTHRAGNAFTYELLWSEQDHTDPEGAAEKYVPDGISRTSRGDLAGISRTKREVN